MHKLIILGIAVVIFELLIATQVIAQTDPIAARQAKNAQLERVSPVMTREKAYTLSEEEAVNQNLRDVQGTLSSINSTLSNLALLGSRAEQARLLLNVDQTTRETLLALFESEAKRVESAKLMATREAQPLPIPTSVGTPTTYTPKQQEILVEPPSAIERVTPVVVRTYTQPEFPAKVILQVGKRDPEVFYVGENVVINGTDYEIVSALPVRLSDRQHRRPVYEISLRSSLGEIKILEWE
jgi:hypothetical protein